MTTTDTGAKSLTAYEAEEAQWPKFLLDAFKKAADRKARSIRMHHNGDEELKLSLLIEEGSKQSLKVKCSCEQWIRLSKCIEHRLARWILSGETKNDPCSQRIFLHMGSDNVILADADLHSSDNLIEFTNIRWNSSAKKLHSFNFNKYQDQAYNLIRSSNSGLLLANSSPDHGFADGVSFCLSLKPEARLITMPQAETTLLSALKESEKRIVILAIDHQDPIELIFEIASSLKAQPIALRNLFQAVIASVVYYEIPKSCNHCLEELPVTKELFEKLPKAVHPLIKDSYKASQGCEACQHGKQLGFSAFSSMLLIDKDMRRLILKGATPAQLTELSYRSGLRSILEDAISALNNDNCVPSQVFETVKKVSPAFLNALSGRLGSGTHHSLSEEIVSQLQNIGDDFFEKTKSTNTHSDEVIPLELDEDIGFGKDETAVTADVAASLKTSNTRPRMLIVEDDDDQQEVMKLMFEEDGYQVVQAYNGKEALDLLEDSGSVDIIVCDLMMPVMNGEEFVKALRDNGQHCNTPLLMLTAIQDEKMEYNLLAAGADDYCHKGTSASLILKRIERVRARSSNPLNSSCV